MFRYLAFAWNDADSAARDATQRLTGLLQSGSPGWVEAFRQNGLAVYCTGARARSSEIYRLENGAGVVLGKLFGRSGSASTSAPLAPGEAESARILGTRGRHLVDRYWGRYVAFLRDASQDATWVLRDPSALLPCLTVRFGGVQVFFSSMEDAVCLGLADFPVDWKYVAGALACQRLQLNATGLQNVSQLLGGECLELARDGISRVHYWNPLHIAQTDVIEDVAHAAQEMRRCARDCVQAWASCHDGIVHTLSGGLDSSIVMACLQDAPEKPRITCVTYHSPGSDGDERHFARLSAQRAGQSLIERERNADLSFEPLLHLPRLSAPLTTFLYYLENARSEAELAARHGATAIFSGNTGDQLFYQALAAFAAGDYMQRRGLRPGAFNVALDSARMDRLSVWHVLRDGFARAKLGRQWNMVSEAGRYSSLLAKDVIEAARRDERFTHPLFKDVGPYPSGKLFHAHTLLFPPDLYNPMGLPADPELIAPLYSQPLIELALRIPTYVLTAGGWDRGVARRAFQHDMPREIVTRVTKGGIEEHAKAIFLKNIGLVRDLLTDGQLVQQGILDRKKLTQVLSGEPTRVASGSVELYDCLAAETWARRWCGAPRLRVAA